LWLKDASFMKLRNAELYYRLPESIRKKIKNGDSYLTDMKISVRGENLYTWTPYNGDPEMYGFNYPTLKAVSLGLSITF